jgi:hypothetical protein
VTRTRVISVPSRVPGLLGYAPKMGAGVGVAPTATWLMRPVGHLGLPAMVGTVGIAPTPSRLQRVVQTIYTTFPKKLAGPEGLAPSRSVLETNPSARTSRTYWCPRPVARRLPLFGRQPCICEHLSGEIGGAGRLRSVSSALQVRRAAIITTAPKWTRRRDLHPRSSALQAGPLAARARRDRK